MKLEDILRRAAENDASDIHIIAGHPPVMRVHTVITPMDMPVVAPETVRAMFEQMRARSPVHQAAGHISATGRPAGDDRGCGRGSVRVATKDAACFHCPAQRACPSCCKMREGHASVVRRHQSRASAPEEA